MELRHLRYFVAVAEALSFTRAAERLNTAQPSLSQQIQDLEQEIGVPLFLRNKRKVSLTPAGKVFFDEARLTLAQARQAIIAARQAAKAPSQKLIIGFVPAAEIKIFPLVLTSLRARFPSLHVEFQSMTTVGQRDALLRDEIDIAFLRPPLPEPSLEFLAVLQEHLVVVLPADHALAAHRVITFKDLTDEPFIEIAQPHGGELSNIIRDAAKQNGIRLNTIQQVEDVLTMLTLISLGEGLALLPDYAESLVFRNVTTRRLAGPSIEVSLLMAWRKADTSAENAALRDLVGRLSSVD